MSSIWTTTAYWWWQGLMQGDVNTAQGYIPVPFNYETALVFDFLSYEADSETWSFLARGQDVTQFMFAEPLSDEQLSRMRAVNVGSESGGS